MKTREKYYILHNKKDYYEIMLSMGPLISYLDYVEKKYKSYWRLKTKKYRKRLRRGYSKDIDPRQRHLMPYIRRGLLKYDRIKPNWGRKYTGKELHIMRN